MLSPHGKSTAGVPGDVAGAHLSLPRLLRPYEEGAQQLRFHLQGDGERGQANWLVNTQIWLFVHLVEGLELQGLQLLGEDDPPRINVEHMQQRRFTCAHTMYCKP